MGSPRSDLNSEQRLTALARILKALRETDDRQQLVDAVLDNLQEQFHYSLVWLAQYDRVEHRLMPLGHRPTQKERQLGLPITLSSGDLLEQVVIQQRTVLVNDLRIEPRIGQWSQLAERFDLQGTLLFPLRRRDACYGVMLLGMNQWGQSPSNEDRTYLSTLLGTLAEALHRQAEQQRQQAIKRPEVPIFDAINCLDDSTAFDDQLETLALTAHRFIQPDRTRIYWFDPQSFTFWERMATQTAKPSNCRRFEPDNSPQTFTANSIRGVYQTLCNGDLLVVGESEGLLVVNLPEHLLRSLRARSLMVAPILSQGDLQGFLMVEGKEPRLWDQAEKDFMATAGRLAGLTVPASTLEATLTQHEADQQFLTGMVRSIHDDSDWRETLNTCGTRLCERMGAQHFLVLLHDSERGGYEVAFHYGPGGRRGIPSNWASLDEVDWQMMERSTAAIAIQDLTQDLKLMAWRDNLQALGIQSLLAGNVSPGQAPEAVILVAAKAPRHWIVVEGELLMAVGQQLGLILHQWQLQRQMNQQGRIYDSIQWGLRSLQRTFQPDDLEAATCRHLLDLLQVSLVALVHWRIGDSVAEVGHFATRHKDFQAQSDVEIPLASDAIINWALQTDGLMPVTLEDFPDSTLDWITGSPGSKFLLMALRTAPDHQPSAVLVLADHRDRRWTDYHIGLITLLGNQLAWSRRHLSLVEMLLAQREELEQLNWYKHKRFDEVHRRLEMSLKRLEEGVSADNSLATQRQQQLLRQLTSLSQSIATMLHEEQWQLHNHVQTTPLISLLNRLMERSGPLIRQRQLWSKVHNDTNVIIGGDIIKIEFILHELLVAACERSPEQGRIDIWCRPLDRATLELSITDDGTLPQQLLDDLENGRPEDILCPSSLDEPPGLHFAICQAMMQQVGGECSLNRLEDGRIMSRIILTIANKGMASPMVGGPATSPFSRQRGR
jgi:GAF domain-containing protein